MDDLPAILRFVRLDQGEGRARHFEFRIAREFADQRPRQGGLAATEPSGQRDDVARLQEFGEEAAEILRRALVGKDKGPGGFGLAPGLARTVLTHRHILRPRHSLDRLDAGPWNGRDARRATHLTRASLNKIVTYPKGCDASGPAAQSARPRFYEG